MSRLRPPCRPRSRRLRLRPRSRRRRLRPRSRRLRLLLRSRRLRLRPRSRRLPLQLPQPSAQRRRRLRSRTGTARRSSSRSVPVITSSKVMNAAGQWTRTDLGGYLTAAPSAVLAGSALDVFYRGAGHRLWERTGTPSGFGPAQRFGQFGPVGIPEAVAQPDGVIDVFWRGYGGVRLWHAQYDPVSGWAGPQN